MFNPPKPVRTSLNCTCKKAVGAHWAVTEWVLQWGAAKGQARPEGSEVVPRRVCYRPLKLSPPHIILRAKDRMREALLEKHQIHPQEHTLLHSLNFFRRFPGFWWGFSACMIGTRERLHKYSFIPIVFSPIPHSPPPPNLPIPSWNPWDPHQAHFP